MIKIGIVGTGYWGKHHLRVFKSLNCQLVGIFDVDKSLVKLAKSNQVKFFADYQQLLKQVTAVSIVTPPPTHYQLANKALAAGKHVLIEKPFVLTKIQAKRLIHLAKVNRLILLVGHIYLYHPAILTLKQLLKQKELGKIYYLVSDRLNLGIVRSDVNALWNFAPHDISIINYLLSARPVTVNCWGRDFLQSGIEDVVWVNLFYPDNIIVNLRLSWLHPLKTRRLTIVGDKKMAVFDDTDVRQPLAIYDRSIDREKIKQMSTWQTYKQFKLKVRFGQISRVKLDLVEPLVAEAQDFLDSINIHKTPRSNAADAYDVLCVLLAANRSLHQGGRCVEINY